MPLKTLSRAQFQKQRPQGKYEAYLKFLAKRRGPVVPQTGAPFSPPPPAVRQQAAPPVAPVRPAPRAVDPYAPLTPAQQQAGAQSEVYPAYNQMVDATVQALMGKAGLATSQQDAQSRALQSRLAPVAGAIRSTYGNAAGTVGADTSRIAAGVGQQGTALQGDLAAKFAQIQAPGQTTTQIAGDAGKIGAGAASTIGALGQADITALQGRGAAESDYAGKLPGIEQMKNLQAQGVIKSDLSEALITQISNLQIEAAKEYRDALKDYRDAEADKAKARDTRDYRNAQLKQADARTRLAAVKETFNEKVTILKLQNESDRIDQGDARLGLSERGLDLRVQQVAQANAQSWARIGISDTNSQISASRSELSWEKYKNGDTKSGITPSQVQKFKRDAGGIASTAWNGTKETQVDPDTGEKVTGRVHMTYQEAMREGLARGIPLEIMQTSLNTYWRKPGVAAPWEKPGSGVGRPRKPFQLRVPKDRADADVGGQPTGKIVQDALDIGPRSGTRYVFGGASAAGYDCSGYTKVLLERRGVTGVPHNAYAQFHDPRAQPVEKKDLRPGDLVFFESSPNSGSSRPPWHVGYYLGGGKYSEYYSSGKPARVNSINARSDYYGARRFV